MRVSLWVLRGFVGKFVHGYFVHVSPCTARAFTASVFLLLRSVLSSAFLAVSDASAAVKAPRSSEYSFRRQTVPRQWPCLLGRISSKLFACISGQGLISWGKGWLKATTETGPRGRGRWRRAQRPEGQCARRAASWCLPRRWRHRSRKHHCSDGRYTRTTGQKYFHRTNYKYCTILQ